LYHLSDKFFRLSQLLGGLIATTIIAIIVIVLLIEAWPSVAHYGLFHFFTASGWFPLEAEYNLAPMLTGTLVITLGAMFIAIPLSLASSIFVVFYIHGVYQHLVTRLLELLSGIPSVVFGLWGMIFVVPALLKIKSPGTSLAAGSIVLATMLIPGLVLMCMMAFRQTLEHFYLAGRSLGLTKMQTVIQVLIPSSLPSLSSAMFLQTARAIGETMAVLMVCGNIIQYPTSLFDPVRTLSTNAALEMAYATGDHRSALFTSGLLLLGLVAILLKTSRQRSIPENIACFRSRTRESL